jgi:hypothetical protein
MIWFLTKTMFQVQYTTIYKIKKLTTFSEHIIKTIIFSPFMFDCLIENEFHSIYSIFTTL